MEAGDIVVWKINGIIRRHIVCTPPRLTKGGYWSFLGREFDRPADNRLQPVLPRYVRQDLVVRIDKGSGAPQNVIGPEVHLHLTKLARGPFCRMLIPVLPNQKIPWKHTKLPSQVTCMHCHTALEREEANRLRKSPLPEGVNPLTYLLSQSRNARTLSERRLAKRRARFYAAKMFWERS